MKINNLSKFGVFSVLLLHLLALVPVASAASLDVQAYGTDTVAGYETLLKTHQVAPWQDVTIEVVKPDGTVLHLSGNSGNDGYVTVTLSDYHTRTAGVYRVRSSLGLSSRPTGTSHDFTVYPDKVSADTSQVMIDKTLVRPDGLDLARITVKLTDSYGNPVSDHLVQLFSNRSRDRVVSLSPLGLTTAKGEAVFSVGSGDRGVSEYRVLDATSGVMLARHVGVAYVASNEFAADAGGDFPFFVDTAYAAAGSLHHFEIAGLPSSIQPNQNVSFTVTAKDDANESVQNYTGKIHFSAEGSNSANVTLPEDYTFKAEDLGTHQFSLGLSFSAAGNYKIVATDLSNTLIKGTKDVVVGGGSGTQQSGGGASITLDTPVSGTYSQPVQTISGKAQSGYTVKVYDNQQEIGSVQATSEGKYSYQTSPLADGQHSVYAVMFDPSQTAKGTSPTVQFAIDTTPPTVGEITLDPVSGIKPGTPISVKVVTEENLSQAAVVFNGDIIELNPSLEHADTYVGSVQAPETPGVYPMDVLLVDQLSNEGSYKEKASVTVSNEGGEVVTQESPATQEPQPETQQEVTPPPAPVNAAPAKVSGLLTYAGNKKVTLVWDAASDTETFVKHYRVYYGMDPANLDKNVDTKDAGTTWYVPDLENGKEYYFAVTAFDSEGLESTGLSEVVSGIPFTTEVASLGQVSGQLQQDFHAAATEFTPPPATTQSGPEMLWLLAGSGLLGTLKSLRKKSRK